MLVFSLKEADRELSIILFGEVYGVDAEVATPSRSLPSVKQSNVSSPSRFILVLTQR